MKISSSDSSPTRPKGKATKTPPLTVPGPLARLIRRRIQSRPADATDKRDWLSGFVPILAIAVAAFIWCGWVAWGAAFVRGQMMSESSTPEAVPGSRAPAAPNAKAYVVEVPLPKNGEAGKVASQSSVAIRVELPEPPKAPAEPPSRLSELGQAGDAFGGANALFSAIAGALLIWAGWLQRRSLIEARKVNARQAFETTFFELLTLTRELESRFKREVKEPSPIFARRSPLNRRTKYARDRSTQSERPFQMPPEVRGSDALSAWAVALMEFSAANGAAVLEEDRLRLVSTFFHNYIYLPNSGSFGPYFRTLYQTFKLIDQSPMSRIEKERYAKIARGMVSEDAVLLLAANAATPAGHRFKFYLRRYALLEHMNPTYKRALRASLLKYVGASSFLRHPGAIRPETLSKYTGAQAYSEELLPLTAGQHLY